MPLQPSTRYTMPRSCERCGVTSYADPSSVKRGQARWCSHGCWSQAKRNKVERTCQRCGVVFLAHPSHIRWRGSRKDAPRPAIPHQPGRRPVATHCGKGHPFAGDNLFWVTNRAGYRSRRCRACHRAQSAIQYQKRKARAQ